MAGAVVPAEKRYAEVVALLQPRFQRQELEPRHEYVLGWALLQSKEYDSAETVLSRLAERSEFPGAEHLLGELALRQDKVEEAEKHFRTAIRLEPDACSAHLGLATVLLERLRDADGRLQRQGAAADTLRAVLATASAHTPPDEVRCNVLLGYAYLQLREFDDAVRHLEAGHRLDPENTDVLFNLAMAHQELGHYDTALACGKDVLQRQPENAAALNFVGYIQAERGQALEESEALVRRALAAEPDNGYYVDSLGWVLFQRGHFAGAVVELERAVALTKHQDAVILEHLATPIARQEGRKKRCVSTGVRASWPQRTVGCARKLTQCKRRSRSPKGTAVARLLLLCGSGLVACGGPPRLDRAPDAAELQRLAALTGSPPRQAWSSKGHARLTTPDGTVEGALQAVVDLPDRLRVELRSRALFGMVGERLVVAVPGDGHLLMYRARADALERAPFSDSELAHFLPTGSLQELHALVTGRPPWPGGHAPEDLAARTPPGGAERGWPQPGLPGATFLAPGRP